MKDEVIRYGEQHCDTKKLQQGREAMRSMPFFFFSGVCGYFIRKIKLWDSVCYILYPIFSWLIFRQLEDVSRRAENIEVRRLKEDLRTSRMEIE